MIPFSSISGRYSAFLDSARPHPRTGRSSFWASDPRFIFRSKKDAIELGERVGNSPNGRYRFRSFQGDPLEILRHLWKDWQAAGFGLGRGGAIGYFGYDLKHRLEKLPDLAKDDLNLPDIVLHFYDVILRSPPKVGDEESSEILRALRALRMTGVRGAQDNKSSGVWKSSGVGNGRGIQPIMEREAFLSMVRRAKEFIARGDIYQANLSQRFEAPFDGDPMKLYSALRQINPSPFMAYLDCGDFQIVSGSPERLIRVEGRAIETRPIAGTRPRGRDDADDRRLRRELLLSPKERAEHIMLVDLERNDLGRVCEHGSVDVDELMVLEPYSHVTHIVSNVKGTLRSGADWVEVVKAVFPGGTITGCPKVRCMEIIERLEPVKRGPYCGSIGYILPNGDMDLNIAIRTFVVKDGKAHVQVGAGIVADSDPEREYDETLHKAQALFEALRVVTQGCHSEEPTEGGRRRIKLDSSPRPVGGAQNDKFR